METIRIGDISIKRSILGNIIIDQDGNTDDIVIDDTQALTLAEAILQHCGEWVSVDVKPEMGYYHAMFGKHMRIAFFDGTVWTVNNAECTPVKYQPIIKPK